MNALLKLALATTLVSSTASAAAGDSLNLKLRDEDDLASGRAGEIYAELRMENWTTEPSANVGKATVQLWNRSGTPYVSYKVTIRVICTGRGTAENFTGSLANSGSSRTLTVRCKEGNVVESTAYITRV